MIRVIHGINGQGKSLLSAELLARWPSVFTICTNLHLTRHHPSYDRAILIGGFNYPISCTCGAGIWRWAGQGRKKNTAFVIDEADVFFDAFTFGQMRTEAWPFFKQHRHYGLEIVLITQFLNILYNRLRDLAAETVLCQREEIAGHWSDVLIPDKLLRWKRHVFRDSQCQNLIRTDIVWPSQAAAWFGTYNGRKSIFREAGCIYCNGDGKAPKTPRETWTDAEERHVRGAVTNPDPTPWSDFDHKYGLNGHSRIPILAGQGDW